MSEPTELWVVRHGETRWNVEGRLQGHLDSQLTDLGRAQAEELATRLTNETFAAIYSSDLGRARQTSLPLEEALSHTALVEPRLRERHLGLFQGLTAQEAATRFPDAWQRFRSREPDWQLPGGESIQQVFDRCRQVLQAIADGHAGQRVLIVTHGGMLNCLYRLCTGMSLDAPRSFPIHNASVNRVSVARGAFALRTWGEETSQRESSDAPSHDVA